MNQPNMNRSINQTLADYVKESAAWQNSLTHSHHHQHHHQQQQQQHQLLQQTHNHHQQQIAPLASSNHATSLPWAAAVKAAEHQQQQQHHHHMVSQLAPTQSAFERASTIGSWSSPETSSSARGGWNADGTLRGDGAPDDGTAIWGNPTVKKTGIDWAEKESLSNPTPANAGASEKRAPKAEPTISSINGTEAWGAPPPAGGAAGAGASASSLISKTSSANNSQQQQPKLTSENSGNIYGGKTISNEPLGWGESSSSSSSLQHGNNESSSPPNNSIWNHLTNNGSQPQQQHQQQQKPSADWLSSSSSASSSIAPANNSSRVDELTKHLESASLFDALSSSSPPSIGAKDPSSSNCGLSLSGNGSVGGNSSSSNSINDLKHMSAKFNSNDLTDPLSRPPMGAMPPSTSTNQQSQMNAYPLGISPSRDLLKQMVHQIQLAVQAGHLNAQILNQPMSTPTLQLVYTLLQQIKLLQQFQEVQQRTVNKPNDSNLPGNLEPQISRVQQNIALLQKAITQQQAALTKNEALADANAIKQQQQQQQQQQAANNFSYANISKLSTTNMKVPSNNMSNIMSNNSIADGFKRSGLMDSLTGNSNSDSQRLANQSNTIDANETIDKSMSPLLQSSVNNILNNNNKARSFASVSSANQQQQEVAKSGMMPGAQTPASSAAAWLAFNSSDLVSSSFSSGGWPTRISANVSQHDQQQQQQQIDSDLLSDYANSRGWRTDNIAQNSSASLAPGANINLGRPSPAVSNMRQMGDTNDILNKDSSPYYEWGNSNSGGGNSSRNFDSAHETSPVSSLSPPTMGGLTLQSNPWLFAQTSSSSMNVGDKLDKADNDKMSGDSLNYLRSNNIQQRSSASSSLYDWGNIGPMQYNSEPAPIGSKQTNNATSSRMQAASAAIGGGGNSRPAPPPGLMSNFGNYMGDAGNGGGNSRSANDMSSLDSSKHGGKSGDEAAHQLPSRDSSASLWSGTWFD